MVAASRRGGLGGRMVGNLKAIHVDPEPPARVGVWGEVATGLRSQITTDNLDALERVRFGFGVGAVGHEPQNAVRHLGEMVVLGGVALWTPVGMDGARTRRESPGVTILSPFMVHWDGRINALFRFEHPRGVSLEALLRSVFDALGDRLRRPAEAASVMVLGQATARQVRDQIVTERMTPDNAPPEGGLIGDPPHRDRFFSSGVVAGKWPGGEAVTLLALALVLDASRGWEAGGTLERAFWPAQDPSSMDGLQIHSHAAVTGGTGIVLESPGASADALAQNFLAGAEELDRLAVVHVMPATQFQRGVVAVGLPHRSHPA